MPPGCNLKESVARSFWRRFDLLHVMIDEPDANMDQQIAIHILAVHQVWGWAWRLAGRVGVRAAPSASRRCMQHWWCLGGGGGGGDVLCRGCGWVGGGEEHLESVIRVCILAMPSGPSAVPAVPQGEGAAVNPPYSMEEMQRYLKYVRAIKPRITPAVRLTPLHAYLLWVPLGV